MGKSDDVLQARVECSSQFLLTRGWEDENIHCEDDGGSPAIEVLKARPSPGNGMIRTSRPQCMLQGILR